MLNKKVPFMVRHAHHERNHPVLTMNGTIHTPFVLSLSKDIAKRFPGIHR